ncbi:MAG: glucose-6-phosphate dehydrogenase [Chloroflexi bacterium]|nr:glucose-6-phosphate dehydrogenase [Chloroflexota bacterium]
MIASSGDALTTLVIVGATGDLSKRKLLPALFNLWCKGRLPANLSIVGFSRSDLSDDAFRELMWTGSREFGELAAQRQEWDSFASHLSYVRGDLGSLEDVRRLGDRLEATERGMTTAANRLYYLSVAPDLYERAVTNFGAQGLAAEDGGWRRIVFEKPFGRNLESARALDAVIHRAFAEHQVYRIDHYLGKETVQNMLVLRFANAIFEPIWNRNYVDCVQITVAETVDVGERAGYYDGFGVVRDMIQNHLLQILTLVAMEPPITLDADVLRDKKVEVLRAVRHWDPAVAAMNAVGAQYEGYRDAPGVPPGSTTPTYVAMRLFIDNWRWQGVPFYLRSGKAVAEKSSSVAIRFRRPPHTIFPISEGEGMRSNDLLLCLQPDEGIHLRVQTKVPDQGMTMRPADMEFHYGDSFKGETLPEAYERLLQDALTGDPSLFIRSDHIDQAWRIVDPLLRAWEQHPDEYRPQTYRRGSWGPGAADALLAEDQQTWAPLCGHYEEDRH